MEYMSSLGKVKTFYIYKYTISISKFKKFSKVRSGMETVRKIESSKTDRRDRPLEDIKVTSASCRDVTPYEEEFKPSEE